MQESGKNRRYVLFFEVFVNSRCLRLRKLWEKSVLFGEDDSFFFKLSCFSSPCTMEEDEKHARSMRFATCFDMCCWPQLMNKLFCQNFVKSRRRPFEQSLFLFRLFFLVNTYLPSQQQSVAPLLQSKQTKTAAPILLSTHIAPTTPTNA